jgi:hypothetical protein
MCRQRIRDVRPFRDKDGIGRCGSCSIPKWCWWQPRPYRAFQGWRYLAVKDAPRDLDKVAPGAAAMPERLRREAARARPDVSRAILPRRCRMAYPERSRKIRRQRPFAGKRFGRCGAKR